MEIASNCFCLEDSRFKELVRCCCSNTPNLRSLTINGLDRFALEEREWASIIALKNLEVLCLVDVSVSLPGVLAITQQCEKLEKFKANSVIVHVPSCEAFRKDFVYVKITAKRFREYELTMQKTMPKYVEELANCASFPQYTLLNIEPEEFADFDLVPGLTQVTELRFSSFQLDEINEEDEFPIFPLLRILRISVVASHEQHLLKQFLNSNGLALRKLILEGVILSKFILAELLILCPNLNSLEFINCDLSGVKAPIEALPQLKTFKWHLDLGLCYLIEDPLYWGSLDVPGGSHFSLDCDAETAAYQMQQNQIKFDIIVNLYPIKPQSREYLSRMLSLFNYFGSSLMLR
ncbi:Hypothetical predicted protein [Cloeon dipterum]|uniref:Uncharacterized protein n=1 Tax=Cloeon dipterum TaxID=197152 RepID=A0A8S1E7R0_9INSE|nr:Hypothetical predicted protein [Cloeon dipterum]